MKKDYKEIKRQKLLAEGKLPKCACGCGEYVKLDSRHQPTQYLRGHVVGRWHKEDNAVDMDKLRKVLRERKEVLGYSWSQMAEKAGITLNHMNSLIYDKRRRGTGVTQELAKMIVARLFDQAAPPSRRHFSNEIRIEGHKERQGLMAYDPDCYG